MSSYLFGASEVRCDLVERFKNNYASFDTDAITRLRQLYDPAVVFIDPLHRLEGWPALERYFTASTVNLDFCRFDFVDTVLGEQDAFFKWHMHYAHKKIAQGRPLRLVGATQIKFGARITYHEDFYDLGAMVYEHMPLLGLGIRVLKNFMMRAGGNGR
ncbi:MAG TPA: nuclear transport factor 2 family protein [Cellvibrionaceae bacterium]